MKFKDVAFRNFRAHFKKYTSYFFCSSFAIMMFFMYSTILFNRELTGNPNVKDMAVILFTVSLVTVAVFSIIFINYAHTAFIKSRYKEFGLFMSLGMTKRDVRKIIILENSFIILLSLITGIITGLVFSRLFHMIVVQILNLKTVKYSLDYKSFALTIAVFAAIFLIVIALGMVSTRKLEISELLKESRKTTKSGRFDLPFGITGIILIIFSIISIIYIANDDLLKTNIVAIGLLLFTSFAGEYLIISRLGSVLLKVLKKKRNVYYDNLLVVTETNYKFKQNKKVLFILTILSAMIIFFMAPPMTLYSLAGHIAEIGQKSSLDYIEISGVNSINKETLDSIIKNSKTSLKSEKDVEFIQLSFKSSDKYDLLQKKPVISASNYNSFMKTNVVVPKGKAININTTWEPGFHGIVPKTKIQLGYGLISSQFIVKDSVHSSEALSWITGPLAYPSCSGIIISDKDYEEIKSKLKTEDIGVIHLINFADWKKTEAVVKNLNIALDQSNKNNTSISEKNAKLFKTDSIVESYKTLKQNYSLFIFTMSFIGILLFIAAITMLYFKQYTEIGADKEKYHKLFKLGIRDSEVKKSVSSEFKFIFFTPLVLGCIVGYPFMYLMTNIAGGETVMKEFMINATRVVVAYFACQVVFYLIASRNYVKQILS